MAKKSSEETASMDEIFDVDKDLEKSGVIIRDLSKESTISEWIDTGVYALNGIISGRLIGGGVPVGRTMEIAGLSGSGKSFFMRRIAKEAQDAGYLVIYIDTENGETIEGFERSGLEVTDRRKFQLFATASIDSIENLLTKKCGAIASYNSKCGKDDEKIKAFIVIDSLGMLRTKTEMEQSDKGEFSQDMGRRAKDIGRMLRAANDWAMRSNAAIAWTNHQIADPSPFASKMFDKSSGGRKVEYAPSIAIQIRSSMNKEETEDASSLTDFAYGENLKVRAKKTRFVIPFLEANLYIDFRTGMSKYSGLLDLAERLGYVKKSGQKYFLLTGYGENKEPLYETEIGKEKDVDCPSFWDANIEKLNDLFIRECSLSKVAPKIEGISDNA